MTESKRDKIVNSALKLFVENGFHATPTSMITRDAGVSAGILFHYFTSKEELIYALFLDIKREFYSCGLQSDSSPEQSIEAAAKNFWSNIWHWGVENPLKFCFLKQYHNSPFIVKVYDDEEIKGFETFVHSYFQHGIQVGVLKDIDPVYQTDYCFNMLVSLIDYLLKQPALKADKLFMEKAWQMYWDAISR